MAADLDALLDEMDAERVKPGQRCHVCLLTPEQRTFVRLARERGHSYAVIARKLRTALSLNITEHSVMNHVKNEHDR